MHLPFLRAIAAAMLVALASSASVRSAAAFPNQMVRITVPFSASSMGDIFARKTADKLHRKWNETVIGGIRLGIGGNAATTKAPADGCTLPSIANGHVILAKLDRDIADVAAMADLKSRVAEQGVMASTEPTAEFCKMLRGGA